MCFGFLNTIFGALVFLCLAVIPSGFAGEASQTVTVRITDALGEAELAPRFLGLSYETKMLLPANGRYYFDARDQALVNTFKTLGIKSLRVGANAVDDASIPVPQERDLDLLFQFARAAGVKVIYSFRLQKGDPAESARLAAYITAHYADLLDAFAIGNEPDLYKPRVKYPDYFARWKLHYDAILQAVPQARFDGPSTDGNIPCTYPLELARDLFAGGHLVMISDHHYFFGSGRLAETNPPLTRARFLSNQSHARYGKIYAGLMAALAAQKIPYRMDELNNCSNGGAKGASDTYAATLWALDCTHWWATHHILGVNFHTGESVGRDGTFGAPNYTSFLRQTNGAGFMMRPMAYALLAFSQGAQGRPVATKLESPPGFDFSAYAFRDHEGGFFVTLINKSYGDHAQTASVTLSLPTDAAGAAPEEISLTQAAQDVAARNGVTLGGAAVDSQGNWSGYWIQIQNGTRTIQVAPASATLLRFRGTAAVAK
jgi:hypothetical protein